MSLSGRYRPMDHKCEVKMISDGGRGSPIGFWGFRNCFKNVQKNHSFWPFLAIFWPTFVPGRPQNCQISNKKPKNHVKIYLKYFYSRKRLSNGRRGSTIGFWWLLGHIFKSFQKNQFLAIFWPTFVLWKMKKSPNRQ